MASRKKTTPPEHEKTLLEKIGEQATHLKEEFIAGKDHFLEAAGEKIELVKETIKDYRAKKKAAAKKTVRKVAKKAAQKPAVKAAKKAVATAKQKTAVKKKAAPKKAAPAKKKAAAKRKVPLKKVAKKAKSILRKRSGRGF
ncbi:MAG: hypothetical protein ABIQ88_16585 [Chitinophagaceae bacterium]